MELRYRREALLGVLIIVGAATFLFLSLWLRGKSFGEQDTLKVVFDDVAGLKVGDPVRTSGVVVGHVSSISLRSPGNVDVAFTIEHAPTPHVDATAEIRAADLFGARYIEYLPGSSREPLGGHEIRGTRLQDMSETAAALGGQGGELLSTVADVSRELHTTLVEARRLIHTLDQGAAVSSDRLAASLEQLRVLLQRTDQIVAQNGPAVGQTMQSLQRSSQNLDRLTADLTRTSAQMDTLLSRINAGRGLAGALVNDTSLVGELRSTNTALRELLVDFKANPSRYIRLRL
jgi:phospholipid/cholesterol/gamma-HCH transport system substrate-binding protein